MAWTSYDNTFTNADRLTSAWLRYWEPFTNRLTSSRSFQTCRRVVFITERSLNCKPYLQHVRYGDFCSVEQMICFSSPSSQWRWCRRTDINSHRPCLVSCFPYKHIRYLLRHSRKWRLIEGSPSLSLVSGCRSLGSRAMLMVDGQARRCRLLDGDVTFFSWFLFIRLNHTRPRYESHYLPICLGVVYTRTSRFNTPSFTIV